MKILNIQLKHIHGGEPRVFLGYTQTLIHSGNEVVALVNPQDAYLNELHKTGAKIVISKKYGNLKLYDIRSIIYFRKLISEINPDVIISHNSRFVKLMKPWIRAKIIDVNHGRSARQSRLADATIVTNSFQLKASRNILGDSHMLYNLRNAAELGSHVPPQLPKTWSEPPVIGTIGRLVQEKGLDIFIDALNLLNRRGTKFKVVMAGEGPERPLLERKIFEFRLGEIVTLSGWAENSDEFYKKIDIFCFPSRREEFGLVLLEAWKHGLPAVVSDADGPADIVTPGVDAIIARRENPAELANALSELLNNKAKADAIAAAAYNKLTKEYAIPVVAKQLQEILEEVTGKRPIKLRNKAKKVAA